MLNFDIGLSALRANQLALDTIANNIANANTPGFHRQSVHLGNRPPQLRGNFLIGSGVDVTSISQARSEAIENELTLNFSRLGATDISLTLSRQIESYFEGSTGSIEARLDQLVDQLQRIQIIPDDPTLRAEVIATGQNLAHQIRTSDRDLLGLSQSIVRQTDDALLLVNKQFQSLANLNHEIKRIENSGGFPNDLHDQHQSLLNELAQYIDIESFRDVEGGFSYRIGSNHQFDNANLELASRIEDDGNLVIYNTITGTEFQFSGGQIAAFQDLHNEVIPQYRGELQRLTETLIQNFDSVHAQGIGLTGSFTNLASTRPLISTLSPLTDSAPAFPIAEGELFVSIIDEATGEKTLHSITINPDFESLDDVASSLSSIDHLNALANAQTGGITLFTQPGYQFDFSGGFATIPDRAGITGDAPIQLGGQYSGTTNQNWTYEILGSGQVGVDDNLQVQVTDESGVTLGTFNLGEGYVPGSEIEVAQGVHIQIDSGVLNDGDQFQSQLIANSDTTGFLTSLGLNTFFKGSQAGDIDIADAIVDEPGTLALSGSGNPGDVANAVLLFETLEASAFENGATLSQFASGITTRVATDVFQLNAERDALAVRHGNLLNQQQAVSGVDPNEEMVQMINYQRAFEASVRVIETMDQMLSDLIRVVG